MNLSAQLKIFLPLTWLILAGCSSTPYHGKNTREIASTVDCSKALTSFFNDHPTKSISQEEAWKLQSPIKLFSTLSHQVINEQRLLVEGFKIDQNGNLVDTAQNLVIGKLSTLKTKYLFLWSDEKKHDFLKSGINSLEMEKIIKGARYQAGPGLYVSTNPISSMGFGEHLTIFQTKEDIKILSFPMFFDMNGADEDLFQRLSRAGVDAITKEGYSDTGGKESWYSMINHLNLEEVIEMNSEVSNFLKKEITNKESSFFNGPATKQQMVNRLLINNGISQKEGQSLSLKLINEQNEIAEKEILKKTRPLDIGDIIWLKDHKTKWITRTDKEKLIQKNLNSFDEMIHHEKLPKFSKLINYMLLHRYTNMEKDIGYLDNMIGSYSNESVISEILNMFFECASSAPSPELKAEALSFFADVDPSSITSSELRTVLEKNLTAH